MGKTAESGKVRLDLDPEGFAAVERLVSFEMGNALLLLNLELQHRFGLRAEEYQVFMLIVLSTVQRFARDREADSAFFRQTPLPFDHSSSISRRRLAEILGIPLETVRRHVGRLSTPGGTLEKPGTDATPERITRRLASLAGTMLRLGAVRIRT